MVFEIIAAAVLIAFGLLSIYFSVSEGASDEKMLAILAIGTAALLLGLWILITKLTLMLLLRKLGGLLLVIVGGFLVFGFPDIGDYQRPGMSKAGIFIGLIILITGLYYLFF